MKSFVILSFLGPHSPFDRKDVRFYQSIIHTCRIYYVNKCHKEASLFQEAQLFAVFEKQIKLRFGVCLRLRRGGGQSPDWRNKKVRRAGN